MNNRVKQLRHYAQVEHKRDIGQAREEFKTQQDLLFYKRLYLFAEQERELEVVQEEPTPKQNRCVIL